jgi:hypothetical protein
MEVRPRARGAGPGVTRRTAGSTCPMAGGACSARTPASHRRRRGKPCRTPASHRRRRGKPCRTPASCRRRRGKPRAGPPHRTGGRRGKPCRTPASCRRRRGRPSRSTVVRRGARTSQQERPPPRAATHGLAAEVPRDGRVRCKGSAVTIRTPHDAGGRTFARTSGARRERAGALPVTDVLSRPLRPMGQRGRGERSGRFLTPGSRRQGRQRPCVS